MTNLAYRALLIAACALALPTASLAQVTVDVTSGWVSSNFEPTDWGPCVGEIGDPGPQWTTIGFDDDDWGAVLTPINHPYRPPSLTGDDLMWDPSGAVQAFMRYELNLAGTPLSGVAYMWGDDNWEFYVNGVLADVDRSDGSGDHPWGSEFAIREIDITGFLVNGENVLAIRGMDGSYCIVQDRGAQKVYFEAQIDVEETPILACNGFHPPMANYPVAVKKNRALPLKADILDADGVLMTDADLVSAPVVQVWYEYGTPDADDVTDDVLPVGEGTEGNQFVFTDDGIWQFNLKTKNYSASGTYTIFMDSGDDTEYVIDPTCETSFVIK